MTQVSQTGLKPTLSYQKHQSLSLMGKTTKPWHSHIYLFVYSFT